MSLTTCASFDEFFEAGTGYRPHLFQRRFADDHEIPSLVKIPTGLGKTAMAVLGWLWRRRFAEEAVRQATPRRLVYCLPMRVLVEQTRNEARRWLEQLGMAADVGVHVLMGGEESDAWDLYPERDAILIGTQDMLLSRTLNRGYGMTRSRWPMAFGLLHNDSLWVFDEVQLMGAGVATSAQLEGLRSTLGDVFGSVRSVWMSATLEREWLRTVDFDPSCRSVLDLQEDLQENADPASLVRQKYEAAKRLNSAPSSGGTDLADSILEEHAPGTLTLAILNTVERARTVYKVLSGRIAGRPDPPEALLLHSRFRSPDREKKVHTLLSNLPPAGRVVVSTQVVEAGIDISARTLFTELAPWASLVQRFGRCNRRGEYSEPPGQVFWVDLDSRRDAAPYLPEGLDRARAELERRSEVSLKGLDGAPVAMPFEHTHVLRRKDFVELFDTTPDLAGNDLDIDRFVRDTDDSDVRVFWRALGGQRPTPEEHLPSREELCPAPIGGFRKFVDSVRRSGAQVYRRNFLERRWDPVGRGLIAPGQVYLVDSKAGGYSQDSGWNGQPARGEKDAVPVLPPAAPPSDDGTEADPLSQSGGTWQTIAAHTDSVWRELGALLAQLRGLAPTERAALEHAARWHDWGKAHPAFEAKLRPEALEQARAILDGQPAAKAPKAAWTKGRNQHPSHRSKFRHELASALGFLQLNAPSPSSHLRDLAAYLVAAHHGKVRLSIRSLPGERNPGDGRRFARGVWDGDELPAVALGGGISAPGVTLSLEPMELGLCEHTPFAGQPSWAERMLRLRDTIGPCRLAFLEAVLRAADMRASSPSGSGVSR